MEISVNIEDYLSESERKNIVKNAFQEMCSRSSKQDFERILSNASYTIVRQQVGEVFDAGMKDVLLKNVCRIVNELTSYTVFKDRDAWDTEESIGRKLLNESILAQKDAINYRVSKIIEEGLDQESFRERFA